MLRRAPSGLGPTNARSRIEPVDAGGLSSSGSNDGQDPRLRRRRARLRCVEHRGDFVGDQSEPYNIARQSAVFCGSQHHIGTGSRQVLMVLPFARSNRIDQTTTRKASGGSRQSASVSRIEPGTGRSQGSASGIRPQNPGHFRHGYRWLPKREGGGKKNVARASHSIALRVPHTQACARQADQGSQSSKPVSPTIW